MSKNKFFWKNIHPCLIANQNDQNTGSDLIGNGRHSYKVIEERGITWVICVHSDMEHTKAKGGDGQEDKGKGHDVDIEKLFYLWHSIQVSTYCEYCEDDTESLDDQKINIPLVK